MSHNAEAGLRPNTDAAIVTTIPLPGWAYPENTWRIMHPEMKVPKFQRLRSLLLSALEVFIVTTALSAPASDAESQAYVPAPQPVDTGETLVGAFLCPLWKEGTLRKNWGALRDYPERKPLLGFYDEGMPEVTDWEIKWALDHGISFFVPCWYRAKGNLGKPVEPALGHWLHDGLFKSRYGDHLKFAILWENGNPIACGVESERDLLENLLPYWTEHYFRRDNYLKVDGKPLLFIYRPDVLIEQLGGEEAARQAMNHLRKALSDNDFEGLLLLGEYHHGLAGPVPHLRNLGFDYAFSYHWPTFCDAMPATTGADDIIAAQQLAWQKAPEALGLPTPITVSMGWDSRPWGSPFSKARWRLAPKEFERLLRQAKTTMAAQEGHGLHKQLLLVDNWNEFAEGHYISPHRQYGFGYLDAIRSVFAPDAANHEDLTPENVGLGPYEDRLTTR